MQDPWANYTVQQFNYTAVVVNLGCPQCHVPGWQSPGGENMAEPLLMGPGMYMAFFVGFCVLSNRVMAPAPVRRFRSRSAPAAAMPHRTAAS